MGNVQNTTTAKRSGVRRSVQVIIAAIVLSALTFPVNGQGAILNDFQRQLLELERETKMFDSIIGDLMDVSTTRYLGEVPRQAELDALKDTARQLLPLARELQYEARDLAGSNLYYSVAPGVELDAEALYRLSANRLRAYYARWERFLSELANYAEATWPADYWESPIDASDESREEARIYRLLANNQYRLDQLEAGPAPR